MKRRTLVEGRSGPLKTAAFNGRRCSTNRRNFLAASAGLLSLPLLDSLSARAADEPYPKRLILLYHPNGPNPDEWFPTPGASTSDFTLGSILEPLVGHQDRLQILGGINSTVAQDPLNNGGPHQRGIGSLFTGQMLQTGDFRDGCGSLAGWADGPSVDQEVAALIGADTAFTSLELGVRCFDNDVQGRISYAAAGQPLPPSNAPGDVYRRLFFRADPLDPSDPNSRQQSILDAVKDQFHHLDRQVGREDREKLAQHLDLVEDLERRLGITTAVDMDGCGIPALPDELDADSEETMDQVSRQQIDLLAAAFACDLTRVASLQYSTGFNRIRYPWVESLKEGHTLSHSGDSNAEAWDEMSRRWRWHAEDVAYLMDKLAGIPEGSGSVLDNTLIVWSSEVGKGNSHALDNLPYLLAGNVDGFFDTGHYRELGGVSNTQLLLTILQAYGSDAASFGSPAHAGAALDILRA